MTNTTSSAGWQEVRRALEPLWVAALGIQFIVGGSLLLPRLIRLLGRGGAVETVEWAIYMSMLFVFPVAVAVIGWWLPRIGGHGLVAAVKLGLVFLLVAELAVYAAMSGGVPVVAALIASGLSIVLLRVSTGGSHTSSVALALACGTAAWMAAGALVSWQSALAWMAGSATTIAVVIAMTVLACMVLRSWVAGSTESAAPVRPIELLPLGLLVAFSFRTFPMVEFYHWGFFVGPIEQLRQGGTLLWDTPSQYGFLSILVTSLLPGNAWQSFWLFQSAAYAVVACLMYLSLRRLSPGWLGAVASLVVTFTTLFFRPRTESLLLPAQMTPAAGPFRFALCFVMLAFLLAWQTRSKPTDSRRFTLLGTAIWVLSLLWSAETAIYVTAMWFPALLIFTLQSAWRSGLRFGTTMLRLTLAFLAPAVAALGAIVLVFLLYRATGAPGPDFLGYLDYVLLYSRGGFGALPIDPTGSIWYLVLAFLIAATMLVIHLRRDPRDPRLIVWAASCGLIWAVSSYFTGRSHPVNLIALVPILLYTLVACMRLRPFETSLRARYAMAATMLPLIAMPAALTAGHKSFASAVAEPQLPVARFTDQVPLMDPELKSLLLSAGAKADDQFVLLGDGRLMLAAWDVPGERPVMRSWLPQPFEIIGSLPAARRRVYFVRNTNTSFNRTRRPEWLIESKVLDANGGDHLLSFVDSTRVDAKWGESEKWIVRLLRPSPLPSR
jgi:hypothetical protein